jgi:hypothetical protein
MQRGRLTYSQAHAVLDLILALVCSTANTRVAASRKASADDGGGKGDGGTCCEA